MAISFESLQWHWGNLTAEGILYGGRVAKFETAANHSLETAQKGQPIVWAYDCDLPPFFPVSS